MNLFLFLLGVALYTCCGWLCAGFSRCAALSSALRFTSSAMCVRDALRLKGEPLRSRRARCGECTTESSDDSLSLCHAAGSNVSGVRVLMGKLVSVTRAGAQSRCRRELNTSMISYFTCQISKQGAGKIKQLQTSSYLPFYKGQHTLVPGMPGDAHAC